MSEECLATSGTPVLHPITKPRGGGITKEEVDRLLEPEVWEDKKKVTASYGHDKDHCFYQLTVAVVLYTRSRQSQSSME